MTGPSTTTSPSSHGRSPVMMEAKGQHSDPAMEAQLRIVTDSLMTGPSTTTSPSSHGRSPVMMEAKGQHSDPAMEAQLRIVTDSLMTGPSTTTSPSSHGRSPVMMEAKGQHSDPAMEAQLRIVTDSLMTGPSTTTSPSSHGRSPVMMEAKGQHSDPAMEAQLRIVTDSLMTGPSTTTSPSSHGRSPVMMEAKGQHSDPAMEAQLRIVTDSLMTGPSTTTSPSSHGRSPKADKAEHIAKEALRVAQRAEKHAQGAEVAAEMSVMMQVGMIAADSMGDTNNGVLGGGQLGRMMADSAHRLGLQVVVLDPLGADSPAGQTGLRAVAGSFTKEEDIATLAEQCDVLTVEIEHVNASFLQQLQDNKSANLQGVHPAPATIALIQDKYQQKQFFTEVKGISVAPFDIVTSLQSARQVGESFGYPYMLKSRRFAYDGRGNAVVKSEKDLVDAFEKLGAKLLATQEKDGKTDEKLIAEEEAKLYAEKWVPFVKELAVMVVKGADGDVRAYPVVETTQRDSICDTVLAPAQIPEDVAKRASEMAQTAVAQLEGRGIYGVELFLTASGEVLLNEIAPRPHNSGHYTIEACETDQFEQHLRAITGLPLGSCALRVPAALMVNVLGDPTSSEDVSFSLLRNSLSVPGAAAHFYGKAGVRPGRKLGHVTITAPNLEELTKRATLLSPEAAKNAGLLALERKPLIGIVMGSDSDLPTMAAAADMLEKFGVPYELTIVSAHRTPARMYEYAQNAAKRGLKAIIAGAGGAAHLPGMIAALTPLPVIGVPVKTSTLNGEDSLLSIVQMPRGVPVATVAIGNSTNAGLLAVRILGAGDDSLIDTMATFLDTQKREVDEKIETMASKGWKEYLQNMKNH
ncbi:hypothetical protein BBJ29_009091 [Phytophthora kernoviae]|uniref:phosphoribosylaminoimidazole carboxylase n=1 Tax=Phytophthora kernoviae TaxID=325452 RepID=A0A3R7JF05_9STRA|nr:hypothetical protein BBJ29_009091 [Phytophthora kernoviae]